MNLASKLRRQPPSRRPSPPACTVARGVREQRTTAQRKATVQGRRCKANAPTVEARRRSSCCSGKVKPGAPRAAQRRSCEKRHRRPRKKWSEPRPGSKMSQDRARFTYTDKPKTARRAATTASSCRRPAR